MTFGETEMVSPVNDKPLREGPSRTWLEKIAVAEEKCESVTAISPELLEAMSTDESCETCGCTSGGHHETRRLAMNSGRTPIDDIRDRLDAERIVDIIYDYDAKIVLDVMSVARTIDLVYRVWREAITEHGRVYDREFQFREFNDLLDA
jgi:hypothetical protein